MVKDNKWGPIAQTRRAYPFDRNKMLPDRFTDSVGRKLWSIIRSMEREEDGKENSNAARHLGMYLNRTPEAVKILMEWGTKERERYERAHEDFERKKGTPEESTASERIDKAFNSVLFNLASQLCFRPPMSLAEQERRATQDAVMLRVEEMRDLKEAYGKFPIFRGCDAMQTFSRNPFSPGKTRG